MNLSGTTDTNSVPFVAPITPQFLADTTLCLVAEEERLLPLGFFGFRECDVQFLLWHELVLLGYDAEMEVDRIDIVIREKTNMIAAIELKGPWLARRFRAGTCYPNLARRDFEKLFGLISIGLLGQFYCLWCFTGEDESAIQDVFDMFLKCALTAAPDCSVESAMSKTLNLGKHGDSRSRTCRVYAVRVYKDSSETPVV